MRVCLSRLEKDVAFKLWRALLQIVGVGRRLKKRCGREHTSWAFKANLFSVDLRT